LSFKKFLILFTLPFIFYACSDSPSSVGGDLVGGNNLEVKKLDSSTDSVNQYFGTFKKTYALGSATRLILGKDQDYSASILVKFLISLSDKIKSDMDSITVLSATVSMISSYKFGDTLAALDFSAHEIQKSWSLSDFKVDSLSQLSYDQTDASSNRTVSDTLTTFNLSNELVYKWLKDEKSSSSANTYGLLIKPKAGTNKFFGYYAYGTDQSLIPNLTIVIQKAGSYTDTVTYYSYMDTHVIEGTTTEINSQTMTVQSGLSYLGKLWFDISKVPVNAIINNATLTLTLDTINSKFGTSYTPEIYVYNLSDSANNSTDDTYLSSLTRSGNKFSGSITGVVNKWIKARQNLGFVFHPATILEGLEKYVFYNSNAIDPTNRPKLTLLYTIGK